MPTRLEDLAHFEVQGIVPAEGPALLGVFTHLMCVRPGRGWLYAGDTDSLIGDLYGLDQTNRTAKFVAPFWTPSSPVQVGCSVPWLDGYWQACHVTMILDPTEDWRRTEFAASPAQFFRQGNLRGWTKVGSDLPDGAIPTHIDDAGWDHEHCELCMAKIGVGGDAHAYIGRHERWLCEKCYQNFAVTRSLHFVCPQ